VLAILRCVFILVMNVHLYHRRYEEDQFEWIYDEEEEPGRWGGDEFIFMDHNSDQNQNWKTLISMEGLEIISLWNINYRHR
jgi:hypothetical protein